MCFVPASDALSSILAGRRSCFSVKRKAVVRTISEYHVPPSVPSRLLSGCPMYVQALQSSAPNLDLKIPTQLLISTTHSILSGQLGPLVNVRKHIEKFRGSVSEKGSRLFNLNDIE